MKPTTLWLRQRRRHLCKVFAIFHIDYFYTLIKICNLEDFFIQKNRGEKVIFELKKEKKLTYTFCFKIKKQTVCVQKTQHHSTIFEVIKMNVRHSPVVVVVLKPFLVLLFRKQEIYFFFHQELFPCFGIHPCRRLFVHTKSLLKTGG